MLIAELKWNKPTNASQRYCILALAWLVCGWMRPAFSADDTPSEATPVEKNTSSLRLSPIATNLSGSLGYQIEQQSYSNANPINRQRLVLDLRGKGITYISKPWIALVTGDIDFTSYLMKVDQYSSTSNTFTGDLGLHLLPYSRYPFNAVLSRSQNYWGPGIGSLVSQTTRLDLTQQYTTRKKMDRFDLGYHRIKSEATISQYRGDGIDFSYDTARLKNQTLTIWGSRDRNLYVNDNIRTQNSNVYARHRYNPNRVISLDDNAILTNRYDDYSLDSTYSRIRELNSTITYRPAEKYYLIGGVRLNAYDYGLNSSPYRSTTFNGNIGASYRPSEFINIYLSANLNQQNTYNEHTRRIDTLQSVNANYPLVSFDIDAWRYNARIGGQISNRTRNQVNTSATGRSENMSLQSITVSPSHGIGRSFLLSGGSMNVGLSQGLSLNESTRGNPSSTLNHTVSLGWARSRESTHTSFRLTGNDSRPLNSAQISYQYINFGGQISEEINRDSRINGQISVQSSRQTQRLTDTSLRSTSANFNLNYSHGRAFGVRRLLFMSNLQAYSKKPIPVLQASPDDQGPITWENTLSYSIGKLVTEFKIYLSKEGNGDSSSLIWFSIKRFF